MTTIEYYIPQKTQIIFVSDFSINDLIGGAELTLDAIQQKSPYRTFFLHSISLTEDLVKRNKDKYFILVNWCGCPKEGLIALVNNKCRYSVVEADFKLCVYRSPQLHELQEKRPCNCNNEKNGKFVEAFYLRAEQLFFMSEKQKQIYIELLPRLKQKENEMFNQGSTWSEEHLDFIEKLFEDRMKFVQEAFFDEEKKKKIQTCAIQSGCSWIKDTEGIIQYCKENGIEYEQIGGLKYEDFLRELSKFGGLIMRPKGWDTSPRLATEAKLLGLRLDLNENVLNKDEFWFKTDDLSVTKRYLRERTKVFWEKIRI